MLPRVNWLKLTMAVLLTAVGPATAAAPAPILLAKRDLTDLSLEELSNIEVTSVSKSPQKWFKSPAAISVITEDDIRRSGVTSIAEALRLSPGTNVARINSSQWAIGVRGFEDRLARSVLVLIDGRAVYSPLFAGTFWEVQDYPLEDIDRIEVIRGPGGTLWGANAFNGVINIITKSAAETPGTLVTAGGGTEERAFGSLRYGGKSGPGFNYRFYGKYFNRDSAFHHNNNDFHAWNMGQGGFRTDWEMDASNNLTLQGDLYKGKTGGQLRTATYAAPFSELLTQDANLFGANLLSRWQHKLTSTADFELQAYYDRTNREDLNYSELRDTFDLNFQNRFALPARQAITWGVGYRLTANHLSSLPAIVFDPADRTDHLANVFVQDQIGLVENKLELTLGNKVEHNNFSGWEYEPSGRLAWTPTENQTVWTAISRAVRTPSQVEQDLQATIPLGPVPFFARQVNNKDFKTEELLAYEAGYRVQPVESVVVSASGFYNQYDDLLAGEVGSAFIEPTPAPAHTVLPVQLVNQMEGETHGAELFTTWTAMPGWRWRATYALLLVHLKIETPTNTTDRPEEIAGGSPRHQASIQTAIDLPKNVEINPLVRYTDTLSYQGVPSYWDMDLRVAWHPVKQLELALVGQSLLQPHHPETSPGSRPGAPLPAVEIQRGFYGKVTWQW